jgi:hypothetical protein
MNYCAAEMRPRRSEDYAKGRPGTRFRAVRCQGIAPARAPFRDTFHQTGLPLRRRPIRLEVQHETNGFGPFVCSNGNVVCGL